MLLADISLALCTGLPNLWITPGGTNLAPACGLYHWKIWAETFLSVTLLSVKSPFLWFCISNYFSRVHMLAFFMSLALCFRRAVVTLLIRRNLHKGISLLLQSNLLALMTSTKFLLLLFNLWRLWAILVQTGVPLLLVCENLLLVNMLLFLCVNTPRQIQNKMAENKHLRNIYCSEPLAGGSHLPVKFNVHICDQLFGRWCRWWFSHKPSSASTDIITPVQSPSCLPSVS